MVRVSVRIMARLTAFGVLCDTILSITGLEWTTLGSFEWKAGLHEAPSGQLRHCCGCYHRFHRQHGSALLQLKKERGKECSVLEATVGEGCQSQQVSSVSSLTVTKFPGLHTCKYLGRTFFLGGGGAPGRWV